MLKKYDKAVSLYLKNCEKNELSAASLESYGRTYRYYREFLAQNGYEEPSMESSIAWKLDLDVSITSLNLYLHHLLYLSNFAVECGIYDKPFISESVMPPSKKVAREKSKEYAHVLQSEDARKLLTATGGVYMRTPQTFVREKAEVTLFILSGLRNSELRALTPNDLDWENCIIHARITKGDKPRYVPFPLTAQKAIEEYLLSNIRPASAGDDAPLFGVMSKDGHWKPFARTQISDLVENYTKSILGKDCGVRTHALRHCAASLALDAGVNIVDIQNMLGHSSSATTAIYAKRLRPEESTRGVGDALDALLGV